MTINAAIHETDRAANAHDQARADLLTQRLQLHEKTA